MSYQNDFDSIMDKLQRGLISADEANVQLVQCAGVKLITGKMRREVRNALNAAVKDGRLGHLKKDGRYPEAYFHINAENKAKAKRKQHERETLDALAGVLSRPIDYDEIVSN